MNCFSELQVDSFNSSVYINTIHSVSRDLSWKSGLAMRLNPVRPSIPAYEGMLETFTVTSGSSAYDHLWNLRVKISSASVLVQSTMKLIYFFCDIRQLSNCCWAVHSDTCDAYLDSATWGIYLESPKTTGFSINFINNWTTLMVGYPCAREP